MLQKYYKKIKFALQDEKTIDKASKKIDTSNVKLLKRIILGG